MVDDSAMIRTMVRTSLEEEGYHVLTASDGVDALDQLAQHPETALVLCDLRMPRMNGHEVLDAVRHDGVYKGPIVLLTTDSGEHITRAEAKGAIGLLAKPFRRTELIATVQRLTTTA